MAILTKKLSIIILLILVIITISALFYIYETFSIEYNINQEIEPYRKNILASDKNALDNFTGTIYPVLK